MPKKFYVMNSSGQRCKKIVTYTRAK